jgi:hypothetical protein
MGSVRLQASGRNGAVQTEKWRLGGIGFRLTFQTKRS